MIPNGVYSVTLLLSILTLGFLLSTYAWRRCIDSDNTPAFIAWYIGLLLCMPTLVLLWVGLVW